VEELGEVLAVDFDATGGIPKLDENLRWEDQEQAVLSACSSLIAVVEDARVVQFSHFSVKEYLTSNRLATSKIDSSRYHHILLEPSHTIMAQACLGVLLRLDSHVDRDSLENFPLALYAAEHFGAHAEFENVLAYISNGIDDLLDADKPHFSAWLRVRKRNHESYFAYPERPEAAPLYHVAGFGFRGMVDYLISKRPEDLTVRGHYGAPLHIALYNGHADIALLLLRHCVDVDVRGVDDRTPLHLAANSGLLEVTRILIERHADINARDSSSMTPLHILLAGSGFPRTSFDEYFEVVRYLLEHGAEVDAQANISNSTPLHAASWFGGVKAAQLLLEHGAKVNARNEEGCTPLLRSLIGLDDTFSDSYFGAIRLLLEHGADVNTQDNDQSTPLHVASNYGSLKAAKLLLEHGASVHLQNNEGQTPFQVASKNGHEEITRLLSEHLKNFNAERI